MYKGKHVHKKTKEELSASMPEEPAYKSGTEVAVAEPEKKTKREKKAKKPYGKNYGLKKAIIIVCAVLVLLGGLYGTFVFSNIPFVAKWRTIYIETAMSTMTHQWLATAFIPGDIVDEVVQNAKDANGRQHDLSSHWWSSKDDGDNDGDLTRDEFYEKFWELDEAKFEAYLDKHPEIIKNGYSEIVIDNLDCSDTTLKTKFGEVIRALNVPDNIIVMKVTGDDFVGALACVKDPKQVNLDKAKNYGSYGEEIESFCKGNVLATNASGFQDTEGVGNGGAIVGSFIQNGKEYGQPAYATMFFGFKEDYRLYISGSVSNVEEYKWAMQFSPALVVNGKSQVQGSYGWGMQPRSAIGQTKNGEFLLLVIDGRQVGYSLGATVEDCANILLKHQAYQAANLDGGSSAIMAYQGEIITKNSSKSANGRMLPNAFVVSHPK